MILLTVQQEEMLLVLLSGARQLSDAELADLRVLYERIYDRSRERAAGARDFANHISTCGLCRGEPSTGGAA